jgi:hypothetical protein
MVMAPTPLPELFKELLGDVTPVPKQLAGQRTGQFQHRVGVAFEGVW